MTVAAILNLNMPNSNTKRDWYHKTYGTCRRVSRIVRRMGLVSGKASTVAIAEARIQNSDHREGGPRNTPAVHISGFIQFPIAMKLERPLWPDLEASTSKRLRGPKTMFPLLKENAPVDRSIPFATSDTEPVSVRTLTIWPSPLD